MRNWRLWCVVVLSMEAFVSLIHRLPLRQSTMASWNQLPPLFSVNEWSPSAIGALVIESMAWSAAVFNGPWLSHATASATNVLGWSFASTARSPARSHAFRAAIHMLPSARRQAIPCLFNRLPPRSQWPVSRRASQLNLDGSHRPANAQPRSVRLHVRLGGEN